MRLLRGICAYRLKMLDAKPKRLRGNRARRNGIFGMTSKKISELRDESVAIQNFLGSLGGLTYQEAMGNLAMDAQAYHWGRSTVSAIRLGITAHFFGVRK